MSRPDAGWTRRFVADPARAREMAETYARAGFEVRLEDAAPDDFTGGCTDCCLVRSGAFQVVFTRPRAAGKRED